MFLTGAKALRNETKDLLGNCELEGESNNSAFDLSESWNVEIIKGCE